MLHNWYDVKEIKEDNRMKNIWHFFSPHHQAIVFLNNFQNGIMNSQQPDIMMCCWDSARLIYSFILVVCCILDVWLFNQKFNYVCNASLWKEYKAIILLICFWCVVLVGSNISHNRRTPLQDHIGSSWLSSCCFVE